MPPPYHSSLFRFWLVLLCAVAFWRPASADQPRGLPFIRSYPLDEIGNVPSGLRFSFDEFGRVAVMYDGVYAVLNDATWVDRLDAAAESKGLMSSVKYAHGSYFFGGRGAWGIAGFSLDGKLKATSLVPPNAPKWTEVTPFNKLLATPSGIFFYELNGLVFWNCSTKQNSFYPMPRLVTAFPVGDRVFVSCQDQVIREILTDSKSVQVAEATGLEGYVVEFAAPFDSKHTLLALNNGSLCLFDGKFAKPWVPSGGQRLEGRITAMERLVEGGVAIAVAGKGIYLFDSASTLKWTLELPEFRRIETMAEGETGVLWVSGGNAVHRVFYDSPLTSFGPQLGLTAIWPQIAAWKDKVLACSTGVLYQMEPASPGLPSTFRAISVASERQANFVAASGAHLLLGDLKGVYTLKEDHSVVPLIQIANVAGLEFITPDTCVVLGSTETTAVKYADGRWSECTPRIPGVGDSPVFISKRRALWIEMGGDLVGRMTFENGLLEMKLIALPWKGGTWTNIGSIDNTIILSGANGQRAYFDDVSQKFIDDAKLDQLLKRSPYWLLRIAKDDSGILWATHAQGIVTFAPRGDDYVIDSATFDMHNDSYPTVKLFHDNDTWIRASRSLYHVEREAALKKRHPHIALVSLIADHQNIEFLNHERDSGIVPRFSFEDNGLSFRFFSGTYAWRFPPSFEYRLGAAETWTSMEPSLFLRLPKLRDGAYRLEVRQSGPHEENAPLLAFPFEVKPPWYRTSLSYGIYGLLLALSLAGIARWMNHRSLQQNAALERIVQERTKELEITMEKLGEKTKNAAILSERSRLAGEIHDSVQQGLSGVILLLDTAMTQHVVPAGLSSQLEVMRKMLSYSREEVQQAVWNLESPLLQNSTLAEALRKLASYINSGSALVKVLANGESTRLEPTIQHNLLRMAQEAITNAVKHAEASQIIVTLDSNATSVLLSIADDGKGFDPATSYNATGHFGLRGLHSRAKAIGASLQIASAAGQGTTVQVSAPLRKNSFDEFNSQI